MNELFTWELFEKKKEISPVPCNQNTLIRR